MEGVSTERLWQRLSRGVPIDHEGDSDGDVHRLLRSVREHLGWLLNSHQGDSSACPEYGLPDLSGVVARLPKSENSFCVAIRDCIVKHEPRLSGVRVRIRDDRSYGGSIVNFSIELVLKSAHGGTRRQLEGAVDLDTVFTLD